MIKSTLVLFLAVFFAALGNVALSKGMQGVGPLQNYQWVGLIHYFFDSVTNPWVVAGIFLELAYFGLWLAVLSWADVSWALPMNAVEYIFVALLAIFWLHEKVILIRWIGILLITIGVLFTMGSWKEQNNEKEG